MSCSYKFKNLLGTVYSGGNLEFIPHEDILASPVGNRLSIFDLKCNKSTTLPFCTKSNITHVAFSPNSPMAVMSDDTSEVYVISLLSKSIVHRKQYRSPITFISFSPNGKKFAIAVDRKVLLYHTPGKTKCTNPFTLNHSFLGAYDDITFIDWTSDGNALVAASRDMCSRVHATVDLKNLKMWGFGGHKNEIIAAFFEENSLDVYSVSKDGMLYYWKCDTELCDLVEENDGNSDGEKSNDEDEIEKIKYSMAGKHYYNKIGENNYVSSANFFKSGHILVTGFVSGSFLIHELPTFNLIHSLKVSDHVVSSLSFNRNGDWIALGCANVGELIIWEWQSESYVLKQRGHFNNMSSLDYSADGQYIATGGSDGKVKIWNTTSGFCFVTFTEHTSEVSQVAFTSNGHVVVSASMDGTVRAFDLHRYRNFRTFTSPRPAQLNCLAVESNGELVAAGSNDTFEIYVWSMQTGKLLDVLAGHEAPVVSLAFSRDTLLASASWDKTVKLWNVLQSEAAQESIQIGHLALAVSFHPSGNELAVSQSNAEITFWNAESATQIGSIDCKSDIVQGVSETDRISARSRSEGNSFHSLCYSANGDILLAGGASMNICLYSTQQFLLMKRFKVSQNLSFDAVSEFVSRRKITEFGPKALVDMGEMGDGHALKLPGLKKGDMSSRTFRPEVRVTCVKFSPSGMEWASATTEGLVIYSLDSDMDFHPFDLEMDVTPKSIRETLMKKDYATALLMAFRLNETNLITEVIEEIPVSSIDLMTRDLPPIYVEKLLGFVAQKISESNHTHFYMIWCQCLLFHHAFKLKQNLGSVKGTLQLLHKNCIQKSDELGSICNNNKYQIEFIKSLSKHICNKKLKTDDSFDNVEEIDL